jgi:hypothetical protein
VCGLLKVSMYGLLKVSMCGPEGLSVWSTLRAESVN